MYQTCQLAKISETSAVPISKACQWGFPAALADMGGVAKQSQTSSKLVGENSIMAGVHWLGGYHGWRGHIIFLYMGMVLPNVFPPRKWDGNGWMQRRRFGCSSILELISP